VVLLFALKSAYYIYGVYVFPIILMLGECVHSVMGSDVICVQEKCQEIVVSEGGEEDSC
jgi:hypothetical protein